jgi:hypothetical protein
MRLVVIAAIPFPVYAADTLGGPIAVLIDESIIIAEECGPRAIADLLLSMASDADRIRAFCS